MPQPQASWSWSRFDWLLGAVVSAAAFLTHAKALGHGFVYDDFSTVLDNPSLRPPLDWWFVAIYDRFRPLTNLSYGVESWLYGQAPFGFHLTSVLLHAVNSFLAFGFLRSTLIRLRHPRPGALAGWVAALFAVHPALTQAVAYVSARSELLCAFFFLAGAWWANRACRSQRWLPWLGVGAFWVLATLSKEVGALLPLAVWLVDATVQGEGYRRRRLRLHLPWTGLVVAAGAGRLAAHYFIERGSGPRGLGENLLLQGEVLLRYLGLLALPLHQSLLHAIRDDASGTGWRALAWGALLSLLAIAFRARKRVPGAWVGVGWFSLALLPVTVVPLNEPMSEHRMYLAGLGFFLAGLSALEFPWRQPTSAPRWVGPLGAAALLLLALATRHRSGVFQDSVTLWQDTVEKSPHIWAARYALGDALRAEGRCPEALVHYRRATELVPSEARAHNNLGVCLATLKRYGEAQRAFLAAVHHDPRYAEAHSNLGQLALLRGDGQSAQRHLQRALALEPQNPVRRQLLERVLRQGGGP